MGDLWSTLGYDATAGRVLDSLRKSDMPKLLQGPPGVGKSWLAQGIGGLWEVSGGSAIVAQGDSTRSEFSYYPFGYPMASLKTVWDDLSPTMSAMTRALEGRLGTGGILTAVVQGVSRVRRERRKQRFFLLDDAELNLLHKLERLGDERPILLIADNLHWWDARSLNLLRRFQERRMQEAYPFLCELRMLLVQTTEPYQHVAHPDAHKAVVARSRTTQFELPHIPRDGFEEVLAGLGAGEDVTPEVADIVFTFSGGNLALASRAATRIAEGSADSFLSANDSDEFVQRLLVDRIDALGPGGAQAIQFLQVASVLGLTFQRREVECAAEVDDRDVSKILRYCRHEKLVDVANGTCRFPHERYRQFFLDAADRVGVHERLSDCFRTLRPAEYELRCVNALRAERVTEAAVLGVQAALLRQREAQPWTELPDEILGVIMSRKLGPVVELFASAHDLLVGYCFSECRATLERLPRDLPKPLLAEADYLRAMCLMSTRCEMDRAEGRTLLAAWAGYEDREPELGIRLARLRIYGLSHAVNKEPALELAMYIRLLLAERSEFDPSAVDDVFVMDRCAGSLYPPDQSVLHNRAAVEHFGPDREQSVLRRPVEYYRCLVNFGAGLIANARYEDALPVYDNVEVLVSEYPPGAFPRLDYPRMNRLLADYRTGHVDAATAVLRQREIVTSLQVAGDPFYVQNALAVYLTLAGSEAEAIGIFDQLEAELTRRARAPEPSMMYLIRANRCAARFVAGEVSHVVLEEWRALADVVMRVPYTFGSILVRRHELLSELIASGRQVSAPEFDKYPVVRSPDEFGPLWKNFGRGFRLPEVEFWREN